MPQFPKLLASNSEECKHSCLELKAVLFHATFCHNRYLPMLRIEREEHFLKTKQTCDPKVHCTQTTFYAQNNKKKHLGDRSGCRGAAASNCSTLNSRTVVQFSIYSTWSKWRDFFDQNVDECLVEVRPKKKSRRGLWSLTDPEVHHIILVWLECVCVCEGFKEDYCHRQTDCPLYCTERDIRRWRAEMGERGWVRTGWGRGWIYLNWISGKIHVL